MLTLENISFEKNYKTIFKNLSFSLSISSALIVTGKNGCGKSSLLKIIAGIYEINQGKILWGNENIKNFRDDFNGDLQYLGHKNFLKPELTIFENLKFYSQLNGTELTLNSALEFFDLAEKRHQFVKNLSTGVQQRVMLAKLLACPATIWLLDEPSSNLDKEWRKKLYDLIKNRIRDKGLVIMATHDEEFFDLGPKLYLEDYC
ncbi:MAG: heme ABC exporter ATP-binding protein CcmA [Proteobacteria bacterium]|nr:heme ABC exporter ATP-binding protein CcmA [Pseudomonadota bacterium]NCA27919.1 heme ABC exporter ATP-binding protein CcmA [Pseudomonadota bacterium]